MFWEFREGKLGRKVVLEHECDFSPDSRFLAGALPDGAIAVYELAAGLEVKRLATELGAGHVTFHPDGRQLAVTCKSDNHVVVVLDLETGKEVKRYPHPQATGAPAWRADGRLLAVGCNDQRIYVWDHAERRLQSVLEGHFARGILVQFSHAGDYLISTAWDRTTRLWAPVSGRQLVLELNSFPVAIRRDDRQMALYTNGRLVLSEVASGWECRTLHHGLVGNRTPRPGDWGPRDVDFSPDGRLLVSSSLDGARLWDMAHFTEIGHFPSGPTATVRFHPDGDSLFTYGPSGLYRWPIRRETKPTADQSDGIKVLQVGPPQAQDVPGNWAYAGLSIDRRGRWLSAVDYKHERTIVLDLDEPGHKLFLDQPEVSACILSPDGRWALSSAVPESGERDIKAVSWKPPVGDTEAFFTPDGRWLVTSPPGNAPHGYWHLGSWQPGPTLPKHTAETAVLSPSPDGALLVYQDYKFGPTTLLAAATGKALATLEPPYDLGSTCRHFSPDGTRLAVTTNNHTIHVWDLRAIRRGLAEVGLDWDMPAYPPVDPGGDARPIRVEVNGGKTPP